MARSFPRSRANRKNNYAISTIRYSVYPPSAIRLREKREGKDRKRYRLEVKGESKEIDPLIFRKEIYRETASDGNRHAAAARGHAQRTCERFKIIRPDSHTLRARLSCQLLARGGKENDGFRRIFIPRGKSVASLPVVVGFTFLLLLLSLPSRLSRAPRKSAASSCLGESTLRDASPLSSSPPPPRVLPCSPLSCVHSGEQVCIVRTNRSIDDHRSTGSTQQRPPAKLCVVRRPVADDDRAAKAGYTKCLVA